MKSKFLKINNPCAEKWENMKPHERGRFCDICSKNVIDFTRLSQVEISKKLRKANGNVCARLTQSQLNTPIFSLDTRKGYNLPFSNIAAGLMIATALTACQTNHTKTEEVKTELVQTTNSVLESGETALNSSPSNPKPRNFSTLVGSVINEKGESIENAKITFVTITKMLTTLTLGDGSFSLEIPVELIDSDNVLRVSYEDIKIKREEGEGFFMGYRSDDYILSKEEIKSNYEINAHQNLLVLGGVGYHSDRNNPVVISNGEKVKYSDFINAQQGEKSSCSLENKDFYYFESEVAMAIYGQEAKYGLFILTSKPKEK